MPLGQPVTGGEGLLPPVCWWKATTVHSCLFVVAFLVATLLL